MTREHSDKSRQQSLCELLDLLGSALMDMHSLHASTRSAAEAEAEYDSIRAEIIIKGAPVSDPGTEKMLRTLLDRAYKMMLQAGYRVAEVNSDHNDPIIAWMSDARHVLYGSGAQPDLARLA